MTSDRQGPSDRPNLSSATPRASAEDDLAREYAGLLTDAMRALADGEAPVAPDPSLRHRLLGALSDTDRFERFVPTVAELADVAPDVARGWLGEVWTGGRWEVAAPSVMAWWVEGGPRTANALRGFVRIAAGQPFPHHRHLGSEHVVIIQGGAELSDGRHAVAGERLDTPSGVGHSFVATAGGTDLLLFTVVHEGLDFGRFQALPRWRRAASETAPPPHDALEPERDP